MTNLNCNFSSMITFLTLKSHKPGANLENRVFYAILSFVEMRRIWAAQRTARDLRKKQSSGGEEKVNRTLRPHVLAA
jgi:hypothetical protein